ncbi:MAG TPA: zinc ribbon domain-containing protein [Planctomycetes bacterium]|nr:zinc ribbon domain-containing protein [Fuerstiella sp.]HIK92106.1 zinc ribbon domain-containing protein [Planctomycetota bacterium]
MPLFEFVCEDCQSEFELLVAHREKAHCPKCDSNRLEKLMSTSAGRVASGGALPISNGCPPAEMGPCSPSCCRLP